MRRHQIVILSFALGIFSITSFVVFFVGQDKQQIQEEPELEYSTVKIFFSNTVKDPQTMYCEKTYPVERAVSRLSGNEKSKLGELAYSAVSELLKGPAKYEENNGFFTSINKEVKVQKIIIEKEIATVDFSDKLNEGVARLAEASGGARAGSCRVQAIRSQISETLKQFPGIKDVVISVNGESETILQP